MQTKPPKRKVLIADDAHETRRSTRLMLATVEEVEVVAIALDGTQAIEMAMQHKPDIVILDLNMPRVNGIAAYKKIVEQKPDTACIIISAEKSPEAVQAAKALGINHYLIKPFTTEELEAAVIELVRHLEQYRSQPVFAQDNNQLRRAAEEVVHTKRTDEEAVRILEEAAALPDCEISWMQTLAMIYVVRQRWGKLKVLTEKLEQRTK